MPEKNKKTNKVLGEKVKKKDIPKADVAEEDVAMSRSAIVRKLIQAGKDKGYLSYDEGNDILTENVVSFN